jgi:hypothetical protein
MYNDAVSCVILISVVAPFLWLKIFTFEVQKITVFHFTFEGDGRQLSLLRVRDVRRLFRHPLGRHSRRGHLHQETDKGPTS